jgi:DNA-binding MarR family transcriptional regulator
LSTQLSTKQASRQSPHTRAFTRLLRAHAALTGRLSAELQEEHGLTINAYEALLRLSREEDSQMKRVDLARSLILTPSGVTRMLDGLEGAGLVERAECPSDRRIVYARLTEAGRAKLDAAGKSHVESIRTVFEGALSGPEIERLADLLERLPLADSDDAACDAAD